MRSASTVLLKWAQSVVARQDTKDPHFSLTRRHFIKNTTKSAIALSVLPSTAFTFGNSPRIAIVGAGLAGLTCAWQLKKAGLDATVYEASDRVGGRTYSVRGFEDSTALSEIGGQYFTSNHLHMIRLARELSMDIETVASEGKQLKPFKAFFGNQELVSEELEKSLLALMNKIRADQELLPKWVTWEHAETFAHLDQISISEYLKNMGVDETCHQFLCKAFTLEYGVEASQQSAVNLLLAFRKGPSGGLSTRIKSLQVEGGNQSLCTELNSRMWNTVQLGHRLVKIHQHTDWYKLEFQSEGKTKTVEADYVVTTLPFSVLRKIKSDVHFPERKQMAINELGYGQKDSLLLSFSQKTWRKQGFNGLTFSDELFGCGNDHSSKDDGAGHVLTILPCGNESDRFLRMGTAEAAMESLASFSKIYPGIYQDFDGQAMKYCWSNNPFSLGSNSCYKVGQYSQFGGEEGKSVENLFFAGEHCSHNFKGTMNGAVETGALAARNLSRRIQARHRRAAP